MIKVTYKNSKPSWARIAILVVSMGLLSLNSSAADSLLRFSPKNIDKSVDACEDFYQYVCGGWLQANPRPAETFAWQRYFSTLGIAPPAHYVVSNPAFLQEVERLLQVISLDDWKLYFRAQLLSAAAPLLSKDFVDEDFDFHGKVMQGIERPSPRSVRCRRAVDRDLPDALGTCRNVVGRGSGSADPAQDWAAGVNPQSVYAREQSFGSRRVVAIGGAEGPGEGGFLDVNTP